MAGISSFKDLVVWRKSFELVRQVYGIANTLPANETYGLASQMKRCAVSIPSNIAEGHQRNSLKEYRNFLSIAKGSVAELETQLLLVIELYDLEIEDTLKLLQEVQKMLGALYKSLEPKT